MPELKALLDGPGVALSAGAGVPPDLKALLGRSGTALSADAGVAPRLQALVDGPGVAPASGALEGCAIPHHNAPRSQ